MQLIIYDNKHKNTVIFFNGFRKQCTTWNITETGKPINIEERIRKNNNTILIDFQEEDYKQSIPDMSEHIYTMIINSYPDLLRNVTIVGHSYGCFYALYLAEKYRILKILLIEPVIKSPSYLEYIINRAAVSKIPLEFNEGKEDNTVEVCTVNNYDMLPTGENIKSRVIVRIHVNCDNEEIKHLKEYSLLTNKNTKSRLVVHYKKSHMIHYTQADVILDSINELLKI